MELQDFHDFYDSGVEYINFNYFRYYGVELYEFHDFPASSAESLSFQVFLNSVMEL